MDAEIVMRLLDEEFKDKGSECYEFAWSELADVASISKRDAINAVNALATQGKITFIEALHHYGDGDYLVRYE